MQTASHRVISPLRLAKHTNVKNKKHTHTHEHAHRHTAIDRDIPISPSLKENREMHNPSSVGVSVNVSGIRHHSAVSEASSMYGQNERACGKCACYNNGQFRQKWSVVNGHIL